MAPVRDWCRHCGLDDLILTKEHIPPKSADNSSPTAQANKFGDSYVPHPVLDMSTDWDEGHTVSTLCDDCNFKPSAWGFVKSYTGLRTVVVNEAFNRSAANGGFDPIANDEFGDLTLPYDFNPRRFLAQCIGMIMAAQRERHLVDNAELSAFIGASLERKATAPTATGLGTFHAWLTLCNKETEFGRMPVLRGSAESETRCWLFFFTPFAFCLTDSSHGPGWPAIDITGWAEFGHHDRLRRGDLAIANFPSAPGGKGSLFT